MVETEQGREMIPCRVETKNPEYDWERSWCRARLNGLGPRLSSFLFKILHNLLPTQERVSRTNQTEPGTCKLCTPDVIEDLEHALVTCSGNQGIGTAVLGSLPLQHRVQGHHALKLQFDLEDHLELPVVMFLSIAWSSIWESRAHGKKPEPYKVRADLEAKVSLLRETRFAEITDIITSMITKL